MKQKPVIPRVQAVQDIQDAVDFYFGESPDEAALGFVDALERAFRHISRYPGTGSQRYAHELDLPNLRSWPLARYPHVVFYMERADRVDVWRILHGQKDIPAWLTAP